MELRLVNPDPKYAPPPLRPPPQTGWLHLAAAVAPPTGPPIVLRNGRRTALLATLAELAHRAQALAQVRQVSIYRAVLLPPAPRDAPRSARFDVAVLVETTSVDALDEARRTPPIAGMIAALHAAGSTVHVMTARCARFLGPVDRTREGLFLFNHFVAGSDKVDTDTAVALWEQLAGWYVTETGLTNSTLLAPTEDSDFLLVNHARWDTSLPRLAADQFRRSTFRTYVRANLRANHVIALPALYRLA